LTTEQKKLCEDNIRLTTFFAAGYKNSGIEFDELKSLASLGLVNAAITYDSTKGEFSTHAGTCIKSMINRSIASLRYKKRTGIVVSLEAPFNCRNEANMCLLDVVADNTEPTELTVEMQELAAAAMEYVTERERCALTLRFGLDGGDPKTLSVVGEHLGVGREQARKIIKKACEKLRTSLEVAV